MNHPALAPPAVKQSRRAALVAADRVLTAAGIDSARADAEWLLAGVLGIRRSALYLEADHALSPRASRQYAQDVRRRAAREPLQRILGWEEFHGLRLRITTAVLVPRPETEMLVDWALELLPPPVRGRYPRIVDLGTGSGCIACALAARRDDLRVTALDVSTEAAAVARVNVVGLGLGRRVHVVTGDLLEAVRGRVADMIVSNPPYLPTPLLPTLAPEVAHHEPRHALDGGPDGLDVIRRVVVDSRSRLACGGLVVLETAGGAQTPGVADLLNEAGFRDVLVHNDLAGTTRFVAGRA
jgi:release factor glutamine methyltransferase